MFKSALERDLFKIAPEHMEVWGTTLHNCSSYWAVSFKTESWALPKDYTCATALCFNPSQQPRTVQPLTHGVTALVAGTPCRTPGPFGKRDILLCSPELWSWLTGALPDEFPGPQEGAHTEPACSHPELQEHRPWGPKRHGCVTRGQPEPGDCCTPAILGLTVGHKDSWLPP